MSAKLSSVISSPWHSPEHQSQKKFSLVQIRLPLLPSPSNSGPQAFFHHWGEGQREGQKISKFFLYSFTEKQPLFMSKQSLTAAEWWILWMGQGMSYASSWLTYQWNPTDFSQGAAFEAEGFFKPFDRHTAYVGISAHLQEEYFPFLV